MAGSGFGLTITAEDKSGNVLTSFNGTVTLALASNPGGATLGGTLSMTAQNGVASFAGLKLDKAGTGYTLLVTANGLASARTNAFDVTPAAASQLLVTAQPPGIVMADSGFGLVVAAEDKFGNVATSFGGSVAVALLNNPGGATLGGTLSVTAQNGVATFSGLTLDKVGTGYTLSIAGSGLIPTTTNAFDVTPALATVLPPTLVGMQSLVNPQSPTRLVLTFSQPMDVARAEDRSNYRVVWAGRDHRLGTQDDRVVPIRRARYDAATQSVTLRLMHQQPLHRTLWLMVTGSSSGGLMNTSGAPLVDFGTGGPGGDHAIHLNLKGLQRPMRIGLLPDGGFETPRALPPDKGRRLFAGNRALAPWRITAGSVNVQSFWPAPEGTRTFDLNGVSAGTIEQSFATVPGQVYQLLFGSSGRSARGA